MIKRPIPSGCVIEYGMAWVILQLSDRAPNCSRSTSGPRAPRGFLEKLPVPSFSFLYSQALGVRSLSRGRTLSWILRRSLQSL
jgi:hypothetical protein